MRKFKGFSLIELIVVMAIMAILIAISIPSFDNVLRQTSKSQVDEAIRAMNSSIVRNLQDYNGVTATNANRTLETTLTPILRRDNDLISRATTITYFDYFYENTTPVQNRFTQVRNSADLPATPDDYIITIALPDNQDDAEDRITFNLNHPVYIIVKTVDDTFIYKNGIDVTSEFEPTTP